MALPGYMNTNRQVLRMPINPMDKSTVFSIFSKKIDERKVTLEPGRFIIEPGTYDSPSSLVVGTSSWWREVDPEQPLIEIPTSSILVADSVVKDYCNGYLGCDMGEKMLGLFFIPGIVTIQQLKKDHKDILDNAKRKQDNWYKELIKMADSLWATSNGNPRTICEDMRIAAISLGLKGSKDWMSDSQHYEKVPCVACGTFGNPNFPVCSNCKTVTDPVKFKALNLQTAV